MRPSFFNSRLILSAIVLALLGMFVLYPGISVLQESFFKSGQWTLATWQEFAGDPFYLGIVLQSLGVSLASALAATLMGTLLAVVVVKTRAPLRKFFAAAAVLPIIIPGFVCSIAYIFLFGRNGLITYQWLDISWNVYGWKSVFILQSVDQATTAFLLAAAGLSALDSRVEDAARNLGAGEWRVLLTVVLPLAMPFCLASLLLNFMRAMSDFGTPLVVGGAYDTLASASYNALIGTYDLGMAATLNIVLLIFSVLAYAGFSKVNISGNKTRMSAQTSRSPVAPTGWAAKSCWLVCLLFSLFVFALLTAVVLAAFTKSISGNLAFSLEHFKIIPERGLQSTVTTMGFALAVGVGVSFTGQTLAYATSRVKIPGHRFIDWLATVPYALPGTFVGVGYAIAFNKPPLILTGTWAIVLINIVVRKLPMGFRAGAAILDRQDRSVAEASEVLGAGPGRTLFKIILPMSRQAMVVGGLYAFISAVQTLGSIIFIITPGTKLLSIDVFEAVVRGELGHAAAFSMIMLVLGAAGSMGIFTLSRAKDQKRKTQ